MSDILKGIKNIKTFEVSSDGFHEKIEKPKTILDEKMDFNFDGNDFRTINQALTYSKAKLFGDKEQVQQSLNAKKPEELENIDGAIKGVFNCPLNS